VGGTRGRSGLHSWGGALSPRLGVWIWRTLYPIAQWGCPLRTQQGALPPDARRVGGPHWYGAIAYGAAAPQTARRVGDPHWYGAIAHGGGVGGSAPDRPPRRRPT